MAKNKHYNFLYRNISLILFLIFIFASYSFSVSAGGTRPAYSKGDPNGDGIIDSTDALILKKIYLNTYEATDKQQYAADTDGDCSISSVDYLLMKKHIIGNYNIEPDVLKEQIPLTEQQIDKIKADYVEYLKEEGTGHFSSLTTADIMIGKYLGPYSGCYLIFIRHREVASPDWEVRKNIAGYKFIFSDGLMPMIYKDSKFNYIEKAYETGLLSKNDVHDLAWYFREDRNDWTNI